MAQYPSIFNDVLGPIMRGPSSSHTAASVRIGSILRQLAKEQPKKLKAEFDPDGSLAATYHSQGADIGIAAGLLGIEMTDSKLLQSLELAESQEIDISFDIVSFENSHPNTFRLSIENMKGKKHHVTALSTGGGMIEFVEIDGFPISIKGDFYETLIRSARPLEELSHFIHCESRIESSSMNSEFLYTIKTLQPLNSETISQLYLLSSEKDIIELKPVLPILAQIEESVPFISAEDLLEFGKRENLSFWELALCYESMRGGIPETEVFEKMREIYHIMQNSVKEGLQGTEYDDRILGYQSHLMHNEKRKMPDDSFIREIIAYVTAIMEVKSSMGVIVAAPTAGSCGSLPGTLLAVGDQLQCSEDTMIKGLLAAGMIGVFIAKNGTFAAELGGCQNECGSGSGMAAAALVELMDGTPQMAVDAASMALQNVIGMVCDPVAERVEVPCLGKNIMCGLNAFASAKMAIAGFDKVIPFDEVIKAMYLSGTLLPPELKCTGNGGLSITKTAQSIKNQLL